MWIVNHYSLPLTSDYRFNSKKEAESKLEEFHKHQIENLKNLDENGQAIFNALDKSVRQAKFCSDASRMVFANYRKLLINCLLPEAQGKVVCVLPDGIYQDKDKNPILKFQGKYYYLKTGEFNFAYASFKNDEYLLPYNQLGDEEMRVNLEKCREIEE